MIAEHRARIATAIRATGCYRYLVSAVSAPRFAYTVGLSESLGFELVLAGAAAYSKDEVLAVLALASSQLKGRDSLETGHGKFVCKPVSPAWMSVLLLGARDYYGEGRALSALQLVPDAENFTLDTPDLSVARQERANRAWRYLDDWPFSVPKRCLVGTTLSVLQGAPVVEVSRWEEDYWEMLPEQSRIDKGELRVIPLGVMLGLDGTLEPSVSLQVGRSLFRAQAPAMAWNSTSPPTG